MTTATRSSTRAAATERLALNNRLKALIIDRLGLQTSPELVSDNQPLFGRGIELDSLDTLELVVAVAAEFEVDITDDDTKAFGSINAMVDHIVDRTQ